VKPHLSVIDSVRRANKIRRLNKNGSPSFEGLPPLNYYTGSSCRKLRHDRQVLWILMFDEHVILIAAEGKARVSPHRRTIVPDHSMPYIYGRIKP